MHSYSHALPAKVEGLKGRGGGEVSQKSIIVLICFSSFCFQIATVAVASRVYRVILTMDCPNCKMSPPLSTTDLVTLSSFTNVPFRLPASSHRSPSACGRKTECLRTPEAGEDGVERAGHVKCWKAEFVR